VSIIMGEDPSFNRRLIFLPVVTAIKILQVTHSIHRAVFFQIKAGAIYWGGKKKYFTAQRSIFYIHKHNQI